MTPSLPPGGRVVSVGVDLADVGRVRSALAHYAERFTARVLTPREADYCLSRPDPAPHVAARFAAKEAVIKCLGGACALPDIEVVRALSGFPSITLRGRAAERAAGREHPHRVAERVGRRGDGRGSGHAAVTRLR